MVAMNIESNKPGLDIRQHFPIFKSRHGQNGFHYLDSAASTQKPIVVVERISKYLANEHANIHRGAYELSATATENYDAARLRVGQFLNVESSSIIFTRGTTEAINLVAYSYSHNLKEGDCILLTLLEHHSNIVPWQLLAKKLRLNIHFAEITDNAELDFDDFLQKLRTHRPKIVAVGHVANSFGSLNPVEKIIEESHKCGAKVLLDAAQSIQHIRIDLTKLNADFLAFSGHKIYGPTGIGALYVKPELVDELEPFQGGGDMISSVTVEGSTWAEFPQRFEAGTPAIAEAIALGSAIDFLSSLDLENIAKYERQLFEKAWDLMSKQAGVTLYGPAVKSGPQAGKQVSIISFNVEGVHPHDLSTIVDTNYNVQIRAGHHCAMPALKRLRIPSSARASIGVYSDITDFEALVDGIKHARKIF